MGSYLLNIFSTSTNALNFCAESQLFGIQFKFFKTNMIKSVAEVILYSQKHKKCVLFLSNLVEHFHQTLSSAQKMSSLTSTALKFYVTDLKEFWFF